MVNIIHIFLSFVSQLAFFPATPPLHDIFLDQSPKSIAVIGAGSAGLAMLKTLVDLPVRTRESLNFMVFEQRSDLGGIWLPEATEVKPPDLPETPLYPLLHTNTPVPSMSYPGFPFLPRTPLFPRHEHVEAYHHRYATHFGLMPYIHFKHEVLEARWQGTPLEGVWNITVRDNLGDIHHHMFEHLVIASGNNHYPHVPSWPGEHEWLATNIPSSGPKREILHSIYYKGPDRYINQSVLVVGSKASGQDIASQVLQVAKKVYVSIRSQSDTPEGVIVKPAISHFTANHVVFVDETTLDVDSIVLATGYEIRKDFLDQGHAIITDPSAHSNKSAAQGLVTNLKYIFPLHQHIFSLCPAYPTNALAFIGLPSAIANCPSDIAQSLFALHAILNSTLLPPRPKLLEELAEREEALRQRGLDPYIIGHNVRIEPSDYQDELVEFLKEQNALPNDGKKFVEGWRRRIFDYAYLKRGWKRIEKLNIVDEWLEGVDTEEEWSSLMYRVNAWQEKWETDNDIPFMNDNVF